MTGSTRLTQAVDAMRKVRAAENALTEPASLKFVVFEDNGGGYHWTILTATGETLVRSASFASHEEAKQAARIVHTGVATASFGHLAGDTPPVDLPPHSPRRDARRVRDDLDAERWLDQGGQLQQRGGDTMASATLIAPPERLAPAPKPDPRRTYSCRECGHVLRVSGLGRHRVYFELDDERADDPRDESHMPACGHDLPGKNPPGSTP